MSRKHSIKSKAHRLFYVLILSLSGYFSNSFCALAQQPTAHANGTYNPILPGYFADPTVKKFGDTFYIYATTDGNGGGLGPSQVWTSKDFVNWTMQDMNWPTTRHYWAPDVTRTADGKYYLFYCQPTVEIYGASSSTPVGPWKPLFADGKAVVPNYLVPQVITLDGQTFRDDDGRQYMVWGTWGIYPGHGCGIGLLNADMRSFEKTWQIPNTLARDFFEAPFLFKRKGIYYLMYSSGLCEDNSYRVQYASSKSGPTGGFTFGKNNPVLASNADGTVHGPGHNSVLQDGKNYYIVYHRHNNPHSGGGYHRQVCADKMSFDRDGNIERIIPSHSGIGYLSKNAIPYKDLALGKKTTASSSYDGFMPANAVDNNNGTLWKPGNNGTDPAWLEVDLGKRFTIKTILTQFEYATWAYQYIIEYAADDQKNWKVFSDKTHNNWHGSPYVDEGEIQARYIRLTVTGVQQPGLYKAIWNIKIFEEAHIAHMPPNLHFSASTEKPTPQGLLVDLHAEAFTIGEKVNIWKNHGKLGGIFLAEKKGARVDFLGGRKALIFNGEQSFRSDFGVPQSLSGNSSFTVMYWVNTGNTAEDNPVMAWTECDEPLKGAVFGFGNDLNFGAARHNGFSDMGFEKGSHKLNKWHHVAITFDGTFERVLVDGRVDNQENKMLFIQPAKQFRLGRVPGNLNQFKGALSSLQIFDKALSQDEIVREYKRVKEEPLDVYLDAAKLPYGKLQSWANEGSIAGLFEPQHGFPVVKDIGGRIGITFTGNQHLKLDKVLPSGMSYSVVTMEYISASRPRYPVKITGSAKAGVKVTDGNHPEPGKWHYIVIVHNPGVIEKFVDGNLKQSERRMTKVATSDTLRFGCMDGLPGSLAIAGIQVYPYALSLQEIAGMTKRWQTQLRTPLANTPVFQRMPKAISPQMASMEAAVLAGEDGLSYNFSATDGEGGVAESGWKNTPAYVHEALRPDCIYHYAFKVRDDCGNVSPWSASVKVSTARSAFHIAADDFTSQHNYLTTSLKTTVWDGLIRNSNYYSGDSVLSSGRHLALASASTNWDGNIPYGPFLYKNVIGDFIAEVEVSDFTGLETKKIVGNIDAGLMVRLDKPLMDRQDLVQNSVFPAWSVGNLVTNIDHGRRQQTNNHSAWNFERYIQIQRDGDLFYLRSSKDNHHWHNLPGSPILRRDFKDKTLQVGLYQSTYGPYQAYGCFKNFRLTTPDAIRIQSTEKTN